MHVPQHWRLTQQRYNLVGEICESCGEKLFPPRDVCPACQQPASEPFAFSGRGKVYSHSVVRQAPRGFEEFAPYTVALVRLDEGPLIAAQITDLESEEVRIGMEVEMVTRKLREDGDDGLIEYGYKFRPRMAVAAQ